MWKEAIICIIISITILIGNYVSHNYVKKSIELINTELFELKEEINKNQNQINNENIKNKMEDIFKKWNERHTKLAYFIEHNELEKVEVNLISLKSFIDANSYENSINKLEESVFSLGHTQEKYKFNLENIF